MDPIQFYRYVIKPTLDFLDLDTPGAAELLLGTALVESNLQQVRQVGGGPALGFYQMEPATHVDLWENYLHYRPSLAGSVHRLKAAWPPGATQLQTNVAYATAMARLHYRRFPDPIPLPGNLEAMAALWKLRYNTYQPQQTSQYVTTQLQRFISRLAEVMPDLTAEQE